MTLQYAKRNTSVNKRNETKALKYLRASLVWIVLYFTKCIASLFGYKRPEREGSDQLLHPLTILWSTEIV